MNRLINNLLMKDNFTILVRMFYFAGDNLYIS